MPWSQIKVLVYFFQTQLAAQEILNGRVVVPKGVIARPSPPSEAIAKSVPEGIAQKTFDTIKELFRQFSESNPEAF
jgi:hypothetical protein